jgi:hypothetical protein
VNHWFLTEKLLKNDWKMTENSLKQFTYFSAIFQSFFIFKWNFPHTFVGMKTRQSCIIKWAVCSIHLTVLCVETFWIFCWILLVLLNHVHCVVVPLILYISLHQSTIKIPCSSHKQK